MINYGIKKGWLEKCHLKKLKNLNTRSGVISREDEKPEGAKLVTETEAIYSMNHLFDSGNLTRIVGISVDIMVTAAISAISLVIVVRYWMPILTIGVVAGVLTTIYVLWLTSRIFDDHHFQHAMVIYGGSTGTMPTGLALLRVIDPQFETPAATDYMYGSGLSFVFLIPFILGINLPVYGHLKGNPIYYWMTAGLIAAYLIFVIVSIRIVAKRGAFGNPLNIWTRYYDEEEKIA